MLESENKITAIVLAAGLSTRMGNENKLLKRINGKTLISQTLENIMASKVDDVIVVVGNIANKMLNAVKSRKDKITAVYNPDFAKGLTSSIQCGVKTVRNESHGFMIALGDMPLITENDYNGLIDYFMVCCQSNDKALVMPSKNGTKGNPVFFSNFYRNLILENTEPEGCKNIIREYKENIYEYQSNHDRFFIDFDTVSDFEKFTDYGSR